MSSESVKANSRGKKIAKWVLAVALFLLVLPEILRFAAIKTIPSTGLGEAEIDDIDVNLFSGTVAVDQFTLTREGSNKLDLGRLSVDINWLKLLLGEFHIEGLVVEGVRLTVVETPDGHWEVIIPLVGGKEETTTVDEQTLVLPKVALRLLSLSDVEVNVQSQWVEGLLVIDELTIEQASTWLQQPISLELTAAWNKAPVNLSLNASPWQQAPSIDGRLRIDRLPLSGITLPEVESLQGAVDMDMRFNAEKTASGDIHSALNGEMSLATFAAKYREIAVDNEVLSWRGAATAAMIDDALDYTLEGNIESSGLSIVDQLEQIPLLSLKRLSVQDVAMDQALNVSVENIHLLTINAMNIDSEDQGKIYTGAVLVDNIKLEQGQLLVVEKAELENGQYHIAINPEGKLGIETALAAVLSRLQQEKNGATTTAKKEIEKQLADSDDEPVNPDSDTGDRTSDSDDVAGNINGNADSNADNSTGSFTIAVKQFDMTGESYLKFTDQRFSVPVQQQLNIQQLAVANLDQRKPAQPTDLVFVGSVGEFSKIKINGQAQPFLEKLALSLKGELDAVELPSISPYSEAYIGYHLTRGQYDHHFDVDIANDEITLNNKLKLRQLALKSVDPDKPQPVEKQLDVPLAFALDMLRDGDDNIELDVPIEGRMDDPSINVNDIINDALGKALKNGAASYLTLALQPYGAVLMAADFVGEQLSTVRLDPIVFAAGENELLPEQLDYTGKIAGLLQERPKLNLTICGQANDSDKAILMQNQGEAAVEEAQLVGLAEQRATAVKRQFVDKGIESQRLFLCQPQFQPEATSAVTLTM